MRVSTRRLQIERSIYQLIHLHLHLAEARPHVVSYHLVNVADLGCSIYVFWHEGLNLVQQLHELPMVLIGWDRYRDLYSSHTFCNFLVVFFDQIVFIIAFGAFIIVIWLMLQLLQALDKVESMVTCLLTFDL